VLDIEKPIVGGSIFDQITCLSRSSESELYLFEIVVTFESEHWNIFG